MREHFFGEKGLTSTSANHIANLSKEFIATQEMYLADLNFLNDTTSISGDSFQTSVATSQDVIDGLHQKLCEIAEATQLISWLREAIKEKNNAIEIIDGFDEYCKKRDIIFDRPVKEKYLTEDDIIKTWNVNKYNAYMSCQTFAAVFGKAVHPDRPFSKARKALSDAFVHPVVVDGKGRDITVVEHRPAYTMKSIDDKFFEIQNAQREYQAKYNQYNHEITTALEDDKAKKDSAYNKAYKKYTEEYQNAYNDYCLWKDEETRRLSNMKIVIPESLVDIYKKISGLGKQ